MSEMPRHEEETERLLQPTALLDFRHPSLEALIRARGRRLHEELVTEPAAEEADAEDEDVAHSSVPLKTACRARAAGARCGAITT